MNIKEAPRMSSAKQALLQKRLNAAGERGGRPPAIPRRLQSDTAPLSFTQQQMWFIDRMNPGNPAYNLPYGFKLRGPLDVRALEKAFNDVIRRHESLRTTFQDRDGEPVQVIHAALRIQIRTTNLTHLEDRDRERWLQSLASEESVRPFDLGRLPLMRVNLFALGNNDHVLMINLHHIVADGLSLGVLLQELDLFYRGHTKGPRPTPPQLNIQYGDFARWQRDRFADEDDWRSQIDYWKNKLRDAPPALELPLDKPRPAHQSFRGSNFFFHLPPELVRDLKSLGEREGCTFFMTVLAVFQVLLQRYSGADDLVIGSPVAARTKDELEPLIGLILNMTALRCDGSGDPTFIELLRRCRSTTLDAWSQCDVPFEWVVNRLNQPGDPARNPVFQVVLQVLSNPLPSLGGLEVAPFEFDLKFAQFDLALHLYAEPDGGYRGRFEYCTDLFEAGTIRRMEGHFRNLLKSALRDPDQPVSRMPMLSGTEYRQLVVDWNRTDVEYASKASIHELFEEQVRRTPDAVALESQGHRLTYRELNERANQAARHLVHNGVAPETKVAICMERSPDLVAGLLGILKSGGAYVPLEIDYPTARLQHMMKDTAAPILLTQTALKHRLSMVVGDFRIICLDECRQVVELEEQGNLDLPIHAGNLAYVIYTSGSTGRPKGVCVEHRNVTRLVKPSTYADLGPRETMLQFAPVAFDASTFELWGSLLNGAKLVICPPGTPSLSELGLTIRECRVTTLWLTAALFHQMVDEQLDDLKGVRQLLAGGEVLSPMHVRKFLQAAPGSRLINGYGPTENTTFTCCHTMTSASRVGSSVPIGRPIGNTRVYVLDAQGQPVPIGVHGELHAGGDGVARGYLNQPELTEQAFIPDPFRDTPGGRLYRTGDRVRYRPDGTIEYHGRIDQQLKLRGFRIEPGEIENCIARDPAVREAVVVAHRDATGEKKLVAYVETDSTDPGLEEVLRCLVAANLPGYMVPSDFVLLETLPLTPNGKIDRQALPEPQPQSAVIRAPRTKTEKALAGIWSAVLGLNQVGMDDDFFASGGNSLRAMRVISRVRSQLGVDLPVRSVFENRTPAALAKAIGALDRKPGSRRKNLPKQPLEIES